jgi:hypothetical protein
MASKEEDYRRRASERASEWERRAAAVRDPTLRNQLLNLVRYWRNQAKGRNRVKTRDSAA